MEKYKLVAIILAVICILQFGVIMWSWSYGNQIVEMEDECGNVICKGYTAYSFDPVESMCYCWSGDKLASEINMRSPEWKK